MSVPLPVCEFAAGWGAGMCALVVGHPLDTVKVWIQIIHKNNSIPTVFKTIYRLEGVKGFYKGMMMPMLASGALNSLYFGTFNSCLRALQDYRQVPIRSCFGQRKPYHHWYYDVFFSGCGAGLLVVLFTTPIELVKTQMQTQTTIPNIVTKRTAKYRGPWDCFMSRYRTSGIRGLYSGLVVYMLRDVPTYGFYALTYEGIVCYRGDDDDSLPLILYQIAGGAMAGLVSWAPAVPLDLIKTRIQSDSKNNPEYRGIVDCAVKSYHKDGIAVFFRGFWITMARALPFSAVTFVSFEILISFCS